MGTEQKSKVAYRKIDPWHSVRRPTVALVALFLFPFQPRSLDFLLDGGGGEDSELELFSLHQHALKCEGFTTCFS